jgi:hypothetical protein
MITIPAKEKLYFEKWIGSIRYEDRIWIDASKTYSLEQAYSDMRWRKHLEQTIGFDYWCAFNYHGHSKVIQGNKEFNYIVELIKYGKNNSLKKPITFNYQSHIDSGKKALLNYFKQIAIDTRQHIFIIFGGGYQPANRKIHFHTSIKFEKTKLELEGDNSFLTDWRDLNPSGNINCSVWGQEYNNQRAGIDYQENHLARGIYVACPKRSKRCKNNKCKGVSIFKQSSIV